MADKQLIQLQPEDEVVTLFYQSGLGDDNFSLGLKEYESFHLGENIKIEKQPLMEGVYVWTYDMTDMWNNYATSSLVMYNINEGVASEM